MPLDYIWYRWSLKACHVLHVSNIFWTGTFYILDTLSHAFTDSCSIFVIDIVGVLEANFIEPAHDKQDFERTSLYLRLEGKLRQMVVEYRLISHSLSFKLTMFFLLAVVVHLSLFSIWNCSLAAWSLNDKCKHMIMTILIVLYIGKASCVASSETMISSAVKVRK